MSTRNRRAEQHRRATPRNVIYVVIATVLVGAAVLAVALSRPQRTTSAMPEVRPVTTTGSALPTFASATADPAIGSTIPTVTGATFDGKPVRIAPDGKAKIVLFVAHWCPHCRREVPLLTTELRRTPLPENVEMITISTGVNADAPNYPPSKWLADVHWPTPVLADDSGSDAAAAYGLSGYPYFVFVGADNRVQYRSSGEMSVADFRTHVAEIRTT